jgi:YHS domain-containing protein
MNRCITCGKTVSRMKAQNEITHEGHTYLVCCPLCEKEFRRDPEHYIAVAQLVFGAFTTSAYSQVAPKNTENTPLNKTSDNVHMMQVIKEAFADIEREYKDLSRHFEKISSSGGIEGLRYTLQEHREKMGALKKKMSIHSGVCKFALSIGESSIPIASPSSGGN